MKKIILSITPNPALDLSGIVDAIKPNEKSYVTSEIKAPGGNAINVARILNRLGANVVATGFLGGHVGKEVESLLKLESVKSNFIQIQDSTRINVTVSNKNDRQQTRLSFPGPRISKSEIQKIFKLFETYQNIKLLTLGGSLPAGFTSQHVKKLILRAKQKGIHTVIDCPGEILKKIISAQPLFIKPNLEEFHNLTETHFKTIPSVEKEARKLLAQVPFVCVSSVENGTLLVTREGSYFGRIPKMAIKSTVGAGDSMVAAIMFQISKGNFSGSDLLRWGLAGSAATLSQPGTNLGSKAQIHKFFRQVKVIKLDRA